MSCGKPYSLAVARKLPLDNPDYLLYLRVGYVASQLLCFAIYYAITLMVSFPCRVRERGLKEADPEEERFDRVEIRSASSRDGEYLTAERLLVERCLLVNC